jgi:hypothetical protein
MKEFILCAAVKNNEDIICGYRHSDCYKILRIFVVEELLPGRDFQGFLTSKKRFVDRVEGLKIALENDQIWHNMEVKEFLTSEDLYWNENER